MRRQLFASAAAIALFAVFDGAGVASAQDAGGASGTSQNPPAAADQAPAAGDQAPATSGGNLPEVKVIQQQAKPKPVKQAKKKPKPQAAPQPVVEAPQEVTTTEGMSFTPPTEVKMSPVRGSEIPIAKVPSTVSTMTAADIASTGAVIPQDFLAQHVPGITVGDLQGNGFQTDVQFRGFESSPVNGVAQGLAVYQNGVRINEAFGDVVNYDFIPEMAIRNVTVMTGNPVFGLNALGGAISFDMQDGFNYHGAEIDVRAGSFGRIQESAQAGMQSGNYAAYLALENINDDGWREFSPTTINRMFADLGVKGDGSEFHVNFSGADNSYGITAAAPEELLDRGWDRTFTSPQVTDNQMAMVSVNGSVVVTPSTTIQGVAYYRHFKQKHIDGNIAEFEPCDPDDTILCNEDNEPLANANGDPTIANPDGVLGSIDGTSQDADSYGFSLQAVNKSKVFGLNNQFLVGTSFDHGHVAYSAQSQVGFFLPHFVVQGTGDVVGCGDEDDCDDGPRNLATINDYVGIYFTNTIDLTSRLSLTVGGRWNYAAITLENLDDPTDEELNVTSIYQRFNPAAGLTYKLLPGLSVYGGYSEANRAPTPGESACADPENPCLIESFLTADPPLKQVVSHTWEAGFRGDYGSPRDHWQWNVGLFRTLNTNDIITQIAEEGTRGYFVNATDTLRQGVEAAMQYNTDRYRVYASYTFTDATFNKPYEAFSPNNPEAGECNEPISADETDVCLQVHKGDRIPGVPQHLFKAGFDYWLTHKWKFGADLLAASSQYFYGDENNSNRPLAGYAKVNLHTSYDVTDHIQIYGLIDNLFDAHFGTYGTFFDAEEATEASLGEIDFKTPEEGGHQRSITPSMPFAAYGGVKVKF
jgi:outer membrane receptor protein involved in Fe transport